MKYRFYFRTKERNKCIFQILSFDNNSDNVKKKKKERESKQINIFKIYIDFCAHRHNRLNPLASEN